MSTITHVMNGDCITFTQDGEQHICIAGGRNNQRYLTNLIDGEVRWFRTDGTLLAFLNHHNARIITGPVGITFTGNNEPNTVIAPEQYDIAGAGVNNMTEDTTALLRLLEYFEPYDAPHGIMGSGFRHGEEPIAGAMARGYLEWDGDEGNPYYYLTSAGRQKLDELRGEETTTPTGNAMLRLLEHFAQWGGSGYHGFGDLNCNHRSTVVRQAVRAGFIQWDNDERTPFYRITDNGRAELNRLRGQPTEPPTATAGDMLQLLNYVSAGRNGRTIREGHNGYTRNSGPLHVALHKWWVRWDGDEEHPCYVITDYGRRKQQELRDGDATTIQEPMPLPQAGQPNNQGFMPPLYWLLAMAEENSGAMNGEAWTNAFDRNESPMIDAITLGYMDWDQDENLPYYDLTDAGREHLEQLRRSPRSPDAVEPMLQLLRCAAMYDAEQWITDDWVDLFETMGTVQDAVHAGYMDRSNENSSASLYRITVAGRNYLITPMEPTQANEAIDLTPLADKLECTPDVPAIVSTVDTLVSDRQELARFVEKQAEVVEAVVDRLG